MKESKCIAVVDGGMIITEAGILVYEGVVPPRMGLPGAAWLRRMNQRLVQDMVVTFKPKRRDRDGNLIADVWVAGTHINQRMLEYMARFNDGQ